MSRDLAHRVEYYSGDMKRRLDLRKLQQPRLIGARQINSTRTTLQLVGGGFEHSHFPRSVYRSPESGA